MTKKNGKIEIPFFISGDIHVSVESFENRTSKIVVDDCILNLVKGKNEELSQLTIDDELKEIFKKMPLKPNTFILKTAEIHFIEKYRSPDVDLSVKSITVEGWNIENQNKSKAKYPATILINGNFEGGKLHAKVELNKQKINPSMRIVSSLSPIQVSNAKNFLKLYADLNVESGTLSATSMINIYDGRLDGFIDPLAKNLVFKENENTEKVKFIKKLKKPILNAVGKIIGKGEEEKIETRIELHGTPDEIKVDVWEIILEGLKNSITIVEKED